MGWDSESGRGLLHTYTIKSGIQVGEKERTGVKRAYPTQPLIIERMDRWADGPTGAMGIGGHARSLSRNMR